MVILYRPLRPVHHALQGCAQALTVSLSRIVSQRFDSETPALRDLCALCERHSGFDCGYAALRSL